MAKQVKQLIIDIEVDEGKDLEALSLAIAQSIIQQNCEALTNVKDFLVEDLTLVYEGAGWNKKNGFKK